jgi:formylmethanofuran dehydrogenase subunit D
MTGNCAALQSLADEPGRVQINRADAQRLGIADQQLVWVSSRRGKVITRADISDRINEGAVYMTYQWWVGACNELTQDNLDPISKTPETKYCAVKVEAIADQRWAEQYAWSSYSEMKARLKAAVNVKPRRSSGSQLLPGRAALTRATGSAGGSPASGVYAATRGMRPPGPGCAYPSYGVRRRWSPASGVYAASPGHASCPGRGARLPELRVRRR